MKVADTAVESFTFGELETCEATIKINAKMFEILSSLYSFPVLAIVRELAANAVDAHKAAGVADKPFDIQIPNKLDPQFKIRDFGTGMSHEFVMNRLARYGDSTKDDNNESIGGFGLGVKSVFSYTSSFMITCFDGTERRVYTFKVGEKGIPVVSLLAKTASNEAAGVEIAVPVKTTDWDEFINAIESLAFFNPRPNILGDDTLFGKTEMLMQTDNWSVIKTNLKFFTHGEYVEMGNILYPVDRSVRNYAKRGHEIPDEWEREHMMRNMMFHSPKMFYHGGRGMSPRDKMMMQDMWMDRMDMFYHGDRQRRHQGHFTVHHAAIGEIDITPNREQIKMTDKTKQFIKESYDRLNAEKDQIIQTAIDARTDSYWKVARDMRGTSGPIIKLIDVLGANRHKWTYKGFELDNHTFEFNKEHAAYGKVKKLKLANDWNLRAANTIVCYPYTNMNNFRIIVTPESGKSVYDKLRKMNLNYTLGNGDVYIVTCAEEDMDTVIAGIKECIIDIDDAIVRHDEIEDKMTLK